MCLLTFSGGGFMGRCIFLYKGRVLVELILGAGIAVEFSWA